MPKINLLDCTLRDGAYITEGNFSNTTILGVLGNLQAANIEMIEVGWLKNCEYTSNSTYFSTPKDIEPFLKNINNANHFLAMIDYGRYDIEKLPPNNNKSIDSIRLVFPKKHFKDIENISKQIKEKGYKLFLQAANTQSYTDMELIQLAEVVNKIMPEGVSIVDTFGVMYQSDLRRIFLLLNNNINKKVKIGFHSHNNLQLSFALSMEFINLGFQTEREIIIDASLCGMGRGAGNTCLELITNYINSQYNGNYNLNIIMDTIDRYIKPFMQQYQWGYDIPYCIAGQLGSHVNNIKYLQEIHKTNFIDMKLILEALPKNERQFYDYDKLEAIYINYQNKEIDDSKNIEELSTRTENKHILLVAPGKTITTEKDKVNEVINTYNPCVIGINYIIPNIKYDFLFFSSKYRYDYAIEQNMQELKSTPCILLSNIKTNQCANEFIINYNRLVKPNWKYFDNSTIMAIRLLSKFNIQNIFIAGFDGYDLNSDSLYNKNIISAKLTKEEKTELNENIKSMLIDFVQKDSSSSKLKFATTSMFEGVIYKEK